MKRLNKLNHQSHSNWGPERNFLLVSWLMNYTIWFCGSAIRKSVYKVVHLHNLLAWSTSCLCRTNNRAFLPVQVWSFFLGLFSVVTMELDQKKDNTILKLSQSGVPDYDTKRTEEGWKRHFWGPIKQVFGYGAQLFWQGKFIHITFHVKYYIVKNAGPDFWHDCINILW